MKSSYVKAGLALLLANIIWGSGPPIFKWAFENVPTFTLAFLRYAIPILIMLIFFRKYLKIDIKDLPILLLSGFFGITVNIAFYFVALHYTASINAAIIGSAAPAFLILGSMFFLKEHPTRKMLLGNLIGLTGILLIIVQPLAQTNSQSSLFGNFLLIISTLGAVINTIMAKEVIKKYHPITLVFWTFLVGTITFYPLFLRDVALHGFLTNLNFQGIFGILYGSLFASLIAWFLFMWAIEYVTASDTSIFSYVQPLASIVIAVPLVHEYPNIFFIIGTLLVFVGIYIAENHKKHPHIHHLMKR